MTTPRKSQPDKKAPDRATARRDFYRIVNERLSARLERGETYTTTRDLYSGYEKLHREGFGDIPPSQTVAPVLVQKPYRGRLFYARNIVTHKAERSALGRTSPYKIYLRDDATPPSGYVLVPLDTPKDRIVTAITEAKGALDATVHTHGGTDATVHHNGRCTAPETHEPPTGDSERLIGELTRVIEIQAALIASLTSVALRNAA